jgi:ABC-type uncharacterized transport system substrate-binding protein
VEVAPKRLELMYELLPTATIAVLINPARPTADAMLRDLQTAARTLGQSIHVLRASNEREIDAAFATLVELRAGALVIANDAYFNARTQQFGALTLRYAVPTIYQFREFVAAGGLMSYGSSITETYRIVGGYTGRILKGEKPANLPVQQATKIELMINLKTAKALGLTEAAVVHAVFRQLQWLSRNIKTPIGEPCRLWRFLGTIMLPGAGMSVPLSSSS